MIDLFSVAQDIQQFSRDNGWKFCFIGGVAVQRWGEPRITQDVDMTLLTGFGAEVDFVSKLLQRYQPRIADAAEFALANRVLLVRSSGGVAIDVALGGLPFEEECVRRASEFEFMPNIRLLTCSAEDLIVLKAFANRAKDWMDIESICIRQAAQLDWSYVDLQLPPLVELKEEPEILTRLAKLR